MSGFLQRMLEEALRKEQLALQKAMMLELEKQGQALLKRYPQLQIYYDNGYRFESIDPLIMYLPE